MAERKVIDGRVVAVGGPAPAGHEGRPYTREIPDDTPATERQERPAQDRMDRGRGARNRKARG